MIRKKSGELVKSSLKMNRSNKNVRFNNNIDIKQFDGSESPETVSTSNSPQSDYEAEDYFSYNHYPQQHHNETIDATDVIHSKKYTMVLHNITDNNNSPYVHVTSVSYKDNKLHGRLYCLNLAFEKHFQLKLSFNGWQSCIIYNNRFKYLTSHNNYDVFEFDIDLFPQSLSFEFVLNYKVNNEIYWDNNDCRNYKIILSPESSSSSSSSTGNNLEKVNDILEELHQESDDIIPRKTKTEYYDAYKFDDFVYNRLNDYNLILKNYCFHSEPSIHLSDEIFF